MNELMGLISNYIRTKRIAINKTQKEMAIDVGISLMTLRRAENGEVSSIEALASLMEAFGDLELFKDLLRIDSNTPRELISAPSKKIQRVRKLKTKDEKQSWKWGDEVNE